jgi:hypothetical protein
MQASQYMQLLVHCVYMSAMLHESASHGKTFSQDEKSCDSTKRCFCNPFFAQELCQRVK